MSEAVSYVWSRYERGWGKVIGKGRPPTMTPSRRGKIEAGLKLYDTETMAKAALGVFCSEWHVENGHTSPEIAFAITRDKNNVERFSNEFDAQSDEQEETLH